MSRGYVKDCFGNYVIDGLKNGFDLGVDKKSFERSGRRVFRNYPTAYANKVAVSTAIDSRVARKKTLMLGKWKEVEPQLTKSGPALFVFPMGAVAKSSQPGVFRPTSDHTRTGLNALFSSGLLKHSLNSDKEMSFYLQWWYYSVVSDVNDAFPILPVAPWLWFAMVFRWFQDAGSAALPESSDDTAFVHLFADFGTSGAPGVFRIFFVEVVLNVARSEMIITLPVVVHVDDLAMIGESESLTNHEMHRLQEWCGEPSGSGVTYKVLKDRPAAIPQFYTGFWWDSRYFSRYLDEAKLLAYLDCFSSVSVSRSLSLRERQSLAGKAQRAILTFPPGASCLIVNAYRMMAGLRLPWHQRRVSKAERDDFGFVSSLLKLNMGRGYYSYDGFEFGDGCLSDASKSAHYTGGGWLCADGDMDYFRYGSRAARNEIDALEGDTCLRCVEAKCSEGSWYLKQIPFGLDNQAFQKSQEKGRSRAERINELLKHLFVLQVRYEFVLLSYWLSSEENFLSDDLSRNRPGACFARLRDSGFLTVPLTQVRLRPDAGRTVTFDRIGSMSALRQTLQEYSSNSSLDGPARGAGVGGDAQLLSVSYTPTSIYAGLPPHLESRLDEVMDNRLAVGSRDKVISAKNRWIEFCSSQNWHPILADDDPIRGGKVVAWVLSMLDETDLVFNSICTYIWGMRTWQVMQHVSDPIFGCKHWREFIRAVAVLSSVPGEPREQVPLQVVRDILSGLDENSLQDCNFGLLLLVLLFTFSRTECPCPKTWTGRNQFESSQHWTVGDFKLLPHQSGKGYVLWVRFKGIKQDARMERPSVSTAVDWLPFDPTRDRHGRDWVPLGDVEGLFSVSKWYMAFVRAVGRSRDDDEPMFLAKDGVRYYTYSCLQSDFKAHVASVGGKATLGPHGIRVLGYNLAKAAVGADLTQAHGGWLSSAHSRYERFDQSSVLGIPSAMLGVDSVFGDVSAPRDILRSRVQRRQPAVPAGPVIEDVDDGSDDAADHAAASEVQPEPHDLRDPPGFTRVEVVPASGGRKYSLWQGPDGTRFRSRTMAWSAHMAVEEHARWASDASFSVSVASSGSSGASPRRARGASARRSASPRRVLPPRSSPLPPPPNLGATETHNLFNAEVWQGLASADVTLSRSARSARPSGSLRER